MPKLSPFKSNVRHSLVTCTAAALALSSYGAFAQGSAQIELRDQSGQTLTTIDLMASTSVTIDPLTGDLIAIPADSTVCSGSGDCDSTVEIESFTIDPTSVTQGGAFTAVFDERGAYECSRTGLTGTTWNSGFQDPDNNVISVIVPSSVATGDYDLVLTCRNGTAGPDALATFERTISITEPDDTIPQVCIDEGRLAPSAWQRESNPLPLSTSTVVQTWLQMFGNEFPNGGANDVRVRPNRYLALKFDTASTEPSGRIAFSDFSGNVTNALMRPALATMSECPGDFYPQEDVDCRQVRVGVNIPAFRWTRTPSTGFQCELPPNTEYYFNLTYVSPESEDNPNPNLLDWQCDPAQPTMACGHRLQTLTD